jgi:BirA family biotin operon repressor/biotin-[acetyl-CoA-carboxylase] ligase
MAFPETFDTAKVQAALVGTRFARDIRHFDTTDSTNKALLEAAASGAAEGTVYVADEQTAGRGRGGHSWHSAPGDGLYVSALVAPSLSMSDALLVSLATGVAAHDAVAQVTGLRVDLRWPNDLLAGGKKLGGILVETSVNSDGSLRYAVIGVGINVLHAAFPEQLSDLATSVRLATGKDVSRAEILTALLRALDLELTRLEAGEKEPLMRRFAERSSWVWGKSVQVPEQGGYTGVTAGLDERGFLRVDSDDGVVRTVLSGGVREL